MATIAAKLAASEREADAARVRAKLKAARLARTGRAGGGNPVLGPPDGVGGAAAAVSAAEPVKRESEREREEGSGGGDGSGEAGRVGGGCRGREEGGEDVDAVDLVVVAEKPRKRSRRTSKAASRRRSTLNPWELQSLIQGDVAAVAAAEGS